MMARMASAVSTPPLPARTQPPTLTPDEAKISPATNAPTPARPTATETTDRE
jgi:hypothetical protein